MDWEKMNFRTEKEGKGKRGRMVSAVGRWGGVPAAWQGMSRREKGSPTAQTRRGALSVE